MKDDTLRALPGEVPNFHERQAAHLRALADAAETPALKNRLLAEAHWHEERANARGEQSA